MATEEQLALWRLVMARLRRGPVPRGEESEMCREVLAAVPGSPQSRQAARMLLEGAMADARTSIADAQQVMQMLRALDRGEVEVDELLAGG